MVVGGFTIGFALIAAIAAWSSRETYRVHLNDLGSDDSVPVPQDEYQRLRREAMANA